MTRRPVILAFCLIFFAVNVWGLYTFVTSKIGIANDFFQRWYGVRAFVLEGRDPYSPQISREVEQLVFGGPPSHDIALAQYPGDFVYPFPFALVIAPLVFFPYEVASALWIGLTGAAIVISFVLMADLFRWRLAPWLLIVAIVWVLTFYPASRGIFLGQPGTMVVCLELIALWALNRRLDLLAGIALGISTYKPQLGLLLLPALGLWALRFGRWHFVVSLIVTTLLMYGVSLVLLPAWPGEWWAQVSSYNGYTEIGAPVAIITGTYLPFLGRPGEILLTVALVGLVAWAWATLLWRRDMRYFNWTVALTLTVTHITLLRTATPHYVVFLVVLVFTFRELYRTGGPIPVLVSMAILTFGLWALFFMTLYVRFESPLMYLPLPLLALLLLLFMRNNWAENAPAGTGP